MNSYYIDFSVVLYTTKVILAESEEEALRIGGELADSDEFWHDHLLPGFEDAGIERENMGYPSAGDDGVDVSLMIENVNEEDFGDGWGRYMSAKEIAAYIGEE